MGEGQTTIVMNDHRQVPVRKTLTVLMGLLPDHIYQISRFNAINIHRLLHINHEDDTLILDGYAKPLTIGEKYKEELKGLFS
jgi:DNA-binding LytR/AlgR family response regulator